MGVRKMDTPDVVLLISAIAAIAAIASSLFAGCVWKIVKRTMIHQALLDVQKDYRSPQMHYAVRTLWDFYREHGEDMFVEEYEKIRKKEDKWVSNKEKQKRIEFEQATLHYQRKLISQFYQHLATLYANGILSKDIIYSSWSEADLRIIPTILVPIENKLREVLFKPPLGSLDENCNLLVLYRNSKDC